jgi:uncharacterized protein YndB with AHSA1/START domain
MPDILHRVGIKSSVDDTYKALTTPEGLAAWWTNNTKGIPKSAECANSALAPAVST